MGAQAHTRNVALRARLSKDARAAIGRRAGRIRLLSAVTLALLAGLAVAVVAYGLLRWITPVDTNKTAAEIDITRVALTVVAGVGGVVALVIAYRRQRDLEQSRFVERFGAAAAQLGATDVAVRIAGVYAMAGVADESDGLRRQQCIDVLCGYLRLPYHPDLGANHQTKLVLKHHRATADGTRADDQERHLEYRHNDREVRVTIVRVISDHLRLTAEHSWSASDFDFRTAHLEDVDFSHVRFDGLARFNRAVLTGAASFDKATFSGTTSFARAIFSHDASFDGVEFIGDASFSNARFSQDASFTRTVFSRTASFNFAGFAAAYFGHAVFSGETSFRGAIFSGTAWFDTVRFSAPAMFRTAAFRGDAVFRNAVFSHDASFRDATFDGLAAFDEAAFSEDISFRRARFSGNAEFGDAAFSAAASFSSAVFTGSASFDSVTFSGSALFFDVVFAESATFTEARFDGETVSFASPRQWGPPQPLFDWDHDLSQKPAHVEPQNWPPAVVGPPTPSS
ncbi:pentapeptide repeat-containing protein [Nocardia brasiliensis]|uniref:pentapeptide repeat-containing protein n=1 Tax=Nocardia brasiliensis TaxID=37326 RepID=UPI0024555468|nr:pentapeptide repeat-containing protein [Nocardia brasiliensis]